MSGAAWGQLWRALAPGLRSGIGRSLRRQRVPGDAEDLLQETFLRVLRAEAAGRMIVPRNPAAYLWRVADHVASDYARSLRAQKRGGGAFPNQLIGDEEIADLRPGPEALTMLALDACRVES